MNDKYPSTVQWNTASQQYPMGAATAYTQNGYYHPSMSTAPNPSHQQVAPNYASADPRSMPSNYADQSYYNNTPHYSSGSPPVSQHMYSPIPTVPVNYAQAQLRSGHHTARPRSTAPQPAYSHSPSHSYSQPYPRTPSSPTHSAHSRVRSDSQAYDHLPSANDGYHQPIESYYTEIPIPQTIGISSDYSTSSARPFSCDLCALSFNRQHDLKRHRETHTGEKPYLCNGGCGKTFTRKDALKRHQLVKSCGKVDESWA